VAHVGRTHICLAAGNVHPVLTPALFVSIFLFAQLFDTQAKFFTMSLSGMMVVSSSIIFFYLLYTIMFRNGLGMVAIRILYTIHKKYSISSWQVFKWGFSAGKKANERLDQKSQIRASGLDLNQLIEKVTARYDIEPEDLKTAGKQSKITLTRRMLCYLAVRKLRLSCTEVARELNISPTAVSRAASVGRNLPDRDKIQRELLKL
jgi:hypothetical protein